MMVNHSVGVYREFLLNHRDIMTKNAVIWSKLSVRVMSQVGLKKKKGHDIENER